MHYFPWEETGGKKRVERNGREEMGGRKWAGGNGREEMGGKKWAGGKGRENKTLCLQSRRPPFATALIYRSPWNVYSLCF
jgi:hypothetical protein